MVVFGIVVVVGGSVVEVVRRGQAGRAGHRRRASSSGRRRRHRSWSARRRRRPCRRCRASATAAMSGASLVPLILDPPPRGDDALTPLSSRTEVGRAPRPCGQSGGSMAIRNPPIDALGTAARMGRQAPDDDGHAHPDEREDGPHGRRRSGGLRVGRLPPRRQAAHRLPQGHRPGGDRDGGGPRHHPQGRRVRPPGGRHRVHRGDAAPVRHARARIRSPAGGWRRPPTGCRRSCRCASAGSSRRGRRTARRR